MNKKDISEGSSTENFFNETLLERQSITEEQIAKESNVDSSIEQADIETISTSDEINAMNLAYITM